MNSDATPIAAKPATAPYQALFSTWKAIVLHPKAFFAALSLEEEVQPALIFLSVVLAVSSLGHLLSGSVLGYAGTLAGHAATQAVFVLALTYGGGLFGGCKDLKNMLRASCFASAPMMLHLLGPLGVAGNLYGLYLLFLGVRRTQNLDSKKSAMTVATACIGALALSALWHIVFHGKHH